jgi:hypothetical protein
LKLANDNVYFEEYKLIQSKIDQYGNSSLQLKGFSVTLALALSTYSIKEDSLIISLFGMVGIVLILYYEGFNSIFDDILKNRALKLENASIRNRCDKIGEPLQIGNLLKNYKKKNINLFKLILNKITLHYADNIIHFFNIFLMVATITIVLVKNETDIKETTDLNVTCCIQRDKIKNKENYILQSEALESLHQRPTKLERTDNELHNTDNYYKKTILKVKDYKCQLKIKK